jgi:BON domain-containing protein
MKRILWGLALAFVTSAFAQQQPPTNSPPYTTPPTFPEGRPQQQMPPDTKAPPPQDLSASEVEQQIQDKLSREPALANTEIGVKIDAKSVTLTGSVDTERQRDLALRIAQSYAARRKIVDKIKIQGQA